VHTDRRDPKYQLAQIHAAGGVLADANPDLPKVFLSLSDDFSAKTASSLCGREDRLKASYNFSESGHDAHISLLTGKAVSHRANLTASKTYSPYTDYRFDMKTFTELKNAQAIVMANDGLNPLPPTFCYLKPYFNDPNLSYFEQLERGLEKRRSAQRADSEWIVGKPELIQVEPISNDESASVYRCGGA